MEERLQQWSRLRGYKVAWGPVAAVREAVSEIEERVGTKEIDADFAADALGWVTAGGTGAAAGTVVVVAVPRSAHVVGFELDDGVYPALLPPTYVNYRPLFEEVRQDLETNGLPGFSVEHAMVPLKATAARLGLVRYGLNNLAYAEEIGSYVQLCAFFTDAPLARATGGGPSEPALLDECLSCGACMSVCPSGAINDERVLLSAHTCLTHANETAGPWPGWVPEWAHTCLLGCLECQKVCPANPELPVQDSGVVFSAAETRALLNGEGDEEEGVESGVRAKLAWLGQPYAESVLGRNLRALLDAGARIDEATATRAAHSSAASPLEIVETFERNEHECNSDGQNRTRPLIPEGLRLV